MSRPAHFRPIFGEYYCDPILGRYQHPRSCYRDPLRRHLTGPALNLVRGAHVGRSSASSLFSEGARGGVAWGERYGPLRPQR